jgi:sugar phosphate isomerase/epimerase
MRLAIISDEVSQDLDTVLGCVRRADFDGVEIRSVEGVPPHQLELARLTDIRVEVDAAGLQVAGFCSPAFKCPLPQTQAQQDQARLLLEHSLIQAEALGSPTVRIFTFYREGAPDPVTAATVASELLAGLDLRGRRVLIETGMRTNTPSVRLLLDFLDRLARDDFGILWDPGNSVFSGWETEPYPDDYLAGRDLIEHVHVKDPIGQREYVRLGDGDLPWPQIIQGLTDDEFAGWVSLETHWRTDRVLSQPERDAPWGEGFSAGARRPSVECMRILGGWARQA